MFPHPALSTMDSAVNTQSPNSIPAMVEAQLDYLRRRRYGRLHFPRPLEDHFEAQTRAARAHRLWFENWIVTACFCLVTFSDYKAFPANFHFALLVRFCIVFPCFAFVSQFMRRNPPRWQRESAVLFAAGLASVSTFVTFRNCSVSVSAGAQITALIALLILNVLLRLRFPWAVAATICCVASDIVFLVTDNQLTSGEKISWAAPVAWAAFFILFAAYSLEHEERRSWLLQLHTEIQGEKLTELNTELARLSALDALTGLANRAAFDQRLDLLWEKAAATSSALSAIVIDIDHFKIVNDTQGHLYGDQVLRRVAALVQQSLRGADDFVARFGGEEFIILLPDTSAEAATRIAERVRALVQLAGSPAPHHAVPQPGLWTTVSCGVSTVTDATRRVPRELIHAADTALYAAKSEGRNCVRSAELTPIPTSSEQAIPPHQTGPTD
jgi:diguanylate cyclase (GGDEF)-like protein